MDLATYKYPADPSCPVCMTEYWDRVRLVRHLSLKNSKCLPAIKANFAPLTSEAARGLGDVAAAVARDRYAKRAHRTKSKPAVRLAGPLPSWAP